jgi:S-adenosylmethionine:diacylglycerol 3-amino-3-carboxypropyl transferase
MDIDFATLREAVIRQGAAQKARVGYVDFERAMTEAGFEDIGTTVRRRLYKEFEAEFRGHLRKHSNVHVRPGESVMDAWARYVKEISR